MNEGFGKMFWGFLFVFLEINLGYFDLLVDPIGYMLIYSGLRLVVSDYPLLQNVDKARLFAFFLILYSVPTVFITNEVMNKEMFSAWGMYSLSLNIVQFVLVFYVFHVMLELAKVMEADNLYTSTSKLSKVYIVIFITLTLLQIFGMNINSDLFIGISVILNFAMIIAMIYYLVHLRRFRKWQSA